MTPHRALVVGYARHPEFQEIVRWLEQHVRVEYRGALEPAGELAGIDPPPAWVFLLASYSGQFTQRQIHQLRRRFPLAECLLVRGAWCEGVDRSPTPPRGVVRFMAHQCAAHLQWCWQGRRGRSAGLAVPFSPVPATAAGEEFWLAMSATRSDGVSHPHPVLVAGRDQAGVAAVRDALQVGPDATLALLLPAQHAPSGARAAVYLASPCRADWPADLRWVHRAVPNGPRIALLPGPRWDERDELVAQGATCVLSWPVAVEHLRVALSCS